jgi:acetolactate synthase-1/3 small subunit
MDTLTDPTHLFRVTLLNEPAAQERLTNALRRRIRSVVEISAVRGGEAEEIQVLVIVRGHAEEVRVAIAHVAKLIDVVSVELLERERYVGVQLALLRIEAAGADQDEASDELARMGARLIRVGPTSLVAQVADSPETLDLRIERLKRWGSITVIRSGLVAIGV